MDGMEQSPQIKEWHRAQAIQEREKEWMLSVMRYLKRKPSTRMQRKTSTAVSESQASV